jgi:hypothetical protein
VEHCTALSFGALSPDATNVLAVAAARHFFRLFYHRAKLAISLN